MYVLPPQLFKECSNFCPYFIFYIFSKRYYIIKILYFICIVLQYLPHIIITPNQKNLYRMLFSKLSKALLGASSLLISYSTTCNDISKLADLSQIVQIKQYRANDKIEDRITVNILGKLKGLLVAVFDGHGGDLCADYASGNISRFLNERIKNNLKEARSVKQLLEKSLDETFDDLESGFKAIFQQNIANVDYQRVGACALAAVITTQHITIANAGDCEGVILGGEKIIKTNERLNAGEPSEQERLQKLFPNEDDIVKCIKNTNYCYVKGRLQPTRSLGDFYLKHSDYNFTNLGIFTGPYITHKPQIKSFNFTPRLGRTLILASDGLWDQLDQNEMNQLLFSKHGSLEIPQVLFNAALKKILERNKIKSFQELDKIENRRNLHDDISIISVNLDEFTQSQKNPFDFFKFESN